MSLLVDENSFGETSTDPDEPQTRNTFNAASCTVKYVTVYLDRAEVCRILRPKVHAGENEILVRGLTPAIDKDSIRVEVKGPATIADVSFVAKYNRDDEEKKAALRAQTQASLAAEQRALESLANRQVRLLKQRDVLNSYADTLIKKPEPASGSGAAGPSASGAAADATESQDNASKSTGGNNNLHAAIDAFDPKHMDTLNSFFDLYEKQAGKLDDDLQETKVKIQAKEEAIKVLERQLRDIEARYAELQSREVSVVLESQEATQLELHFSYVVSRARWSPKYDIRVFSNESAMKIIYYGMVQQNTGEDWENAQISLSTSMPGVGGTVPPLTVQKAHFKSNKPVSFVSSVVGGGGGGVSGSSPVRRAQSMRTGGSSTLRKSKHMPVDEILAAEAADDASMASEQAGRAGDTLRSGGSNIQSTQFEVPRLFTIPCDGEEHKVTIAIIDLCPTFEYESVPQRAPYAYLKAAVTNTSNYALLAGPTNIYVDNNFIGKSELKAAAPSEEFHCTWAPITASK
ncbi:hypothetical protein BOX15_Mlig023287g1 [Macrostomum lignano]|uniref:DUF4139 domain-containing protein n=1 Tax=Macrostomum lignano TaxID=282301 RepID=A0A267DY07_9PLAT|nr:hypothetical protein BOX15_Mlig023287g1 [Macrostomum lignano]